MSVSPSGLGHSRTISSTSFASSNGTDYDPQFLFPPTNDTGYFSGSTSPGASSPGASGDESPVDFSPEGELRRSPSAGSKGRKTRHVSQACDSCKLKKAACTNRGPNTPCDLCRKNKEDCKQTVRDNRRTPNKQYVASLEQVNQQLDKERQVWQIRERSLRKRIAALEDRLRTAGIEDAGREGRQLTISIPVPKQMILSNEGPGKELVNTGEVLIRDETGALATYGGPSPLAHLPSSPSPSPFSPLPSSPPAVIDNATFSTFVPPAIQLQSLQSFFAHSGTELLPLGYTLVSSIHRTLNASANPTAFPVPSPLDEALPLTSALYYSLLSVALPFAPPDFDPNFRTVLAHEASQDLPSLFRAPSLANVLALGLLATYYASVSEHDVGWQCAGMSARMMQSLGLHLDHAPDREKDPAWALSNQERRFRNLVYWIVFIQDKFWSMWVGRAIVIADDGEVPLPDAAENNDTELIFQALCSLMRVANKVMPAVYGAHRTSDAAEINNCRLTLDTWYEHLPPLLRPTPKAMTTASTSLRHLHLTFHWLKILLDRPFYRPISQALHQELGVHRCDTSLRQIMQLLAPWLAPNTPHVPLTPLGAQIVLSAGITWLQSAVAFSQSQKRQEEGTTGARQCLRLLVLQGATMPCSRQFAGILRRLMKTYFTSVDIDGGQRAMLPPIAIPQPPPMADTYQQQDYFPTSMFGAPLSAQPYGGFDSSVIQTFGPTPRRTGSTGASAMLGMQNHYIGPDTAMIEDMSQYLQEWTMTVDQNQNQNQTTFHQPWIMDAGDTQLADEPFGMDDLSMDGPSAPRQRGPELGREDTIMPLAGMSGIY